MNETRDLFGHEPAQASLFGSAEDRIPHQAPRVHLPQADDVRRRLHALLAAARAASHMPWDARQARTYQTTFPQMANWLPEEEANQLRFAFAQELERLKRAA